MKFGLAMTMSLSRNGFEALLAEHVDVGLYGRGAAKSVDLLFDEVQAGESRVMEDPLGRLVRLVSVVCVRLRAKDLFLLEKAQTRNGVRRERNLLLAGKIGFVERDPRVAAERELREELPGFPVSSLLWGDAESRRDSKLSTSYPGLPSVYETTIFDASLPDEQVEALAEQRAFGFRWEEDDDGNILAAEAFDTHEPFCTHHWAWVPAELLPE